MERFLGPAVVAIVAPPGALRDEIKKRVEARPPPPPPPPPSLLLLLPVLSLLLLLLLLLLMSVLLRGRCLGE